MDTPETDSPEPDSFERLKAKAMVLDALIPYASPETLEKLFARAQTGLESASAEDRAVFAEAVAYLNDVLGWIYEGEYLNAVEGGR
jgi:hypothetical protein